MTRTPHTATSASNPLARPHGKAARFVVESTSDLGASADAETGSREPSPDGLGPSGFDPARVQHGLYRVHWASGGTSLAAVGSGADGERWIAPTNWLRPAALSGEGWGAVERLEPISLLLDAAQGLAFACAALREVGDDYPGSSCQKWCHEKADDAEAIAEGEVE